MEPIETFPIRNQGIRVDVYPDGRVKIAFHNPHINDPYDFMAVWLPEEISRMIIEASNAVPQSDRHKVIDSLCGIIYYPMSAFSLALRGALVDIANLRVERAAREMKQLGEDIIRLAAESQKRP